MDKKIVAKEILLEALKALPDDFALSEARFHIKAAIAKIEHVETKRERREEVKKQIDMAELVKKMSPAKAKDALEYLDSMIEEEKQKLTILEKVTNGDDVSQLLD